MRWATPTEQARNRRWCYRVEINGVTKTIPEWEEITGIHNRTLTTRYKRQGLRGLDLIAPVRKKK